MRRSKEDTAQTRRQIVTAASRLFRARGIDKVSVADVMEAVGLTVGGFYRHFDSKDALVAEAITEASMKTVSGERRTARELIEGYVSAGHAANAPDGCPIVALCSEIHREGATTKAAFTDAVNRMAAAIGSVEKDRKRQLQLMAASVGAVVLARAVDDATLKEEILSAVRSGLKKR